MKARNSCHVKLSLDSSEISGNWTIVLGETLETMNKEQWDCLLKYKYIVFARFFLLYEIFFILVSYLILLQYKY